MSPQIAQSYPIMNTGVSNNNTAISIPIQYTGTMQYETNVTSPPVTGISQLGGAIQGQNSGNGLFDMMRQIQQTNMTFLNRLASIENSVSCLGPIQQEIGLMRHEMSNLKMENANMSTKVNQVESSCQFMSSKFDEHAESKMKTEKDVQELQRQKVILEYKLNTAEQNYSKLSGEIQELKARSMQENLLFFGLAESIEGGENTENKLRQFLKNELSFESPDAVVDNIVFDRVHRLGRRRGDPVNNPRPIVANFEKYQNREKIRQAGIELNEKRTMFSVREQFPPEMEETRKQLYPVMRRYKRDKDNKVFLVRDKLYVNGLLYSEEKRGLIKPKSDSNRSEGPVTNFPRGTFNSERRNCDTQLRRPYDNERQHVSFEHPNRYERLQQPETPGGNESTGLKRKPTSPALDETLTKRSVYLSNDDDRNRMDTGRVTITADVHQPVDSEREREGTAWGATPTAEDVWDAPQPSKRPSSPEVHITIHDSTETQLSDTSKLIASSMRMNAETNIENIDSNTDSSTSCKQVNGATL